MKKFSIKHNLKIQKDGLTIKGQILDVEWGEFERGYEDIISEKKLYIKSSLFPEFKERRLFIWGDKKTRDLEIISYTYKSKEEAKKMMDFINKYSAGYKEYGIKIEKDTITIDNVSYTIYEFKEHYSKCSSALKKWNNEFKSL